ncbi:DUF1513 domain-containing protein [Thalassobaculum sp. OXR-137]|uniref:DUF1513 domain-containing protein n=1 Tax=Thalassobaculum sp. OXR-137 TaxID=3100173 RepID=UPI002AC9376B|nr:DUF1513 domain-containing protein [Thalassobaculum sp. OXR-137]WPZ36063.1 DUF1513 domain-containing protein [Thalassobaculum sp. OXR-137]
MRDAVPSRRQVLAALASLPALSALPALAASRPAVVTTAKLAAGGFAIVGLDADGRASFVEPLPDRGHGVVPRPGGDDVAVIARRPGRFGYVVAAETGAVRAELDLPDTRHYYGHAAYSADGRLLYTTENAFDEDRGVLGVWDATAGYARVGEVDSAGIGPHEVRRAADDGSLWVANGGILTHPDSGRIKLNLPTMEPTLARVAPGGTEAERVLVLPAELHKLSMRHVATHRETVAVAMQYEGPESDIVPLVAVTTTEGGVPRLLDLPDILAMRSRQYTGDVAFDPTGAVVGAGLPRGGFFAFWSVQDGRFLGSVEAPDGCAIATGRGAGGFVISTGTGGRIGQVTARPAGVDVAWTAVAQVAAFDNHLMAAS